MVYFNRQDATAAAIGGVVLAIATTANLWLMGRNPGMSSVIHSTTKLDGNTYWKSCILSGVIISAGIAFHVWGFSEVTDGFYLFEQQELFDTGLNLLTLILGGFLVGLGTRLGDGDVTGHAIIGLPKLSLRSVVGTATFAAFGVLVANTKQYLPKLDDIIDDDYHRDWFVNAAIVLAVVIVGLNLVSNHEGSRGLWDVLISWGVGFVFGWGLIISGFVKRSKVLGLLTISDNWDPSLLISIGVAVLINFLAWHFLIRSLRQPIIHHEFAVAPREHITTRLIVGSALFGIGWGLSGLCPGPAVIVTPLYAHSMIIFLIPLIFANYLGYFIDRRVEAREAPLLVK